jgi:hypothetical protein
MCADYLDNFFSIGNAYGGVFIQPAGDVGSNLININTGDQAVCYMTAQIAYTPSTFVA